MRDILAALLHDRGYIHDERDSDDYWYGPTLGVRPLMACVEWELTRERVSRARGECDDSGVEAAPRTLVTIHFEGGPWQGATQVERVIGPLFAVGHPIGGHYWLDTNSQPPTYHWHGPDAKRGSDA